MQNQKVITGVYPRAWDVIPEKVEFLHITREGMWWFFLKLQVQTSHDFKKKKKREEREDEVSNYVNQVGKESL